MSTNKDYTVVGIYNDNQESWTGHISASSAKEALDKANQQVLYDNNWEEDEDEKENPGFGRIEDGVYPRIRFTAVYEGILPPPIWTSDYYED